MKINVVTVVMHKNGRLHLAIENISADDSARWAEEGYQVFVIACTADKKWAVNYVNDGRVFDSSMNQAAKPGEQKTVVELLQHREGN